MRLTSYLILMSALALAASPIAAKAGDITEEILRLEREYDRAYARAAADAFDRMHTEDFRLTARGKVAGRAEILRSLKTPAARAMSSSH